MEALLCACDLSDVLAIVYDCLLSILFQRDITLLTLLSCQSKKYVISQSVADIIHLLAVLWNDIMKVIVRRMIGVAALLFVAAVVVPKFVLTNGDRLAYNLDHWALVPASLLAATYCLMLCFGNRESEEPEEDMQVVSKIIGRINAVEFILLCVVVFFYAIFEGDHKVHEDNKYVMYGYVVYDDDYGGFITPHDYTLYKRNGIINEYEQCIGLWLPARLCFHDVDFTIYEQFDLIREEADVSEYGSDSLFHVTNYYRLSDGYAYDQSQNDSLIALTGRQ